MLVNADGRVKVVNQVANWKFARLFRDTSVHWMFIATMAEFGTQNNGRQVLEPCD